MTHNVISEIVLVVHRDLAIIMTSHSGWWEFPSGFFIFIFLFFYDNKFDAIAQVNRNSSLYIYIYIYELVSI